MCGHKRDCCSEEGKNGGENLLAVFSAGPANMAPDKEVLGNSPFFGLNYWLMPSHHVVMYVLSINVE